MHFVVCIKQVPDSAQIRVHPVTNTIMRQGVPTIINPYDLFSLEEALRWRDKVGGEVTVLTMGPPMASDSLRKALTIGADRAVLLTDRFFAGSDTLATSFALSAALKKIGETFGKIDIVFCGKQTIDGDTAQVGPGVAKRLSLEQITYVSAINEVNGEDGTVTLERRSEGGVQVLKTNLPAMITMLEGSNTVRRGRIDDALRAARAEIVSWNAKEAGIEDVTMCGLRGSPTVVKKVFAPSPRAEKAALIEVGATPAASAEALIEAVLAKSPKIEDDLIKLASGF